MVGSQREARRCAPCQTSGFGPGGPLPDLHPDSTPNGAELSCFPVPSRTHQPGSESCLVTVTVVQAIMEVGGRTRVGKETVMERSLFADAENWAEANFRGVELGRSDRTGRLIH